MDLQLFARHAGGAVEPFVIDVSAVDDESVTRARRIVADHSLKTHGEAPSVVLAVIPGGRS